LFGCFCCEAFDGSAFTFHFELEFILVFYLFPCRIYPTPFFVFDLFSNCAFHKPTNKSLIGGPEKLKKKEDGRRMRRLRPFEVFVVSHLQCCDKDYCIFH